MARKTVWKAADSGFLALLAAFAEDADRQRARGLAWRADTLAGWTTSAILWRLAELGISPEEESLREDARTAGSPHSLAALWRCQTGATGLARELLSFAADEVWKRLLPEATRGEVDLLRLADYAIEDQCRERPTTPEELRARYDAAMAIPPLATEFRPEDPAAGFRELQTLIAAPVTIWAAELAPALAAAGLVQEAQALCLAWAPLDARERFLAERAVILAEGERDEEASAQIDQLLHDYPRSLPTQVYVAEALVALGELEEAHAALERARVFATSSEERKWAGEHLKTVLERVMDLAEEEEKKQAWDDEEEGEEELDEEIGIPLVREEEKVGRNDPCPCGSGKKYKKCCGSAR